MSKWSRFIACSDLHGDMQDRRVVGEFLEFNQGFRAEIRIFMGDLFDLRGLRSKATPEERAESMRNDWQMGLNFLEKFRPQHLLFGNHDYRLFHWAETKQGIEKDYAQQGVTELLSFCKKHGIHTYPYDKKRGVLRIGKLGFLHGYAHGVSATRRHAAVYKHCVFGHTHAADCVTFEDEDRSTAHNAGCLCLLDLGYNAATISTLRQQHGWVYGSINNTTGNYYLVQARKVDGKWFTPKL